MYLIKDQKLSQSLNVENKPKECKAQLNHGSKVICAKCTFRDIFQVSNALINMGVDRYTCLFSIIATTIGAAVTQWEELVD